MYELPNSGLFLPVFTFRKYEWKDMCLIFFSSRYFWSYGSNGMQ